MAPNAQPVRRPLPLAEHDCEEVQRLVAEARAGSLASFSELVASLQSPIFNFLIRRLGCEQDAADATQETFVRAWQSLDDYDPRWRFCTWLFTIASRRAVDHQRRRRRRLRLSAAGRPREYQGRDVTEAQEELAMVWKLAETALTADQRSLLWLRYGAGLSVVELARVLGRSQVAARVQLLRALRRLRAALAQSREPLPIREANTLGLTEAAGC